MAPVPAPPPQPTFLNRELPKVGVILSAGGMKAFAHLGVLREMNRARIPIHSIVGLEWGAIMGGLYSVQGQINDAEWKAFKLRESDLPGESRFLSFKAGSVPVSIATLREFLDTTFTNALIEKSRIAFYCGSNLVKGDRPVFYARGSMKDAMSKCVPYPPFYQDNAGSVAAPMAISEAAEWLRSRGANVIVLVDVLGQGEIFDNKHAAEQKTEFLLWNEVRREVLSAKAPLVNWVIRVNTSGHPINDFAGRRELMDAGVKAASEVVNKMNSQYGF